VYIYSYLISLLFCGYAYVQKQEYISVFMTIVLSTPANTVKLNFFECWNIYFQSFPHCSSISGRC